MCYDINIKVLVFYFYCYCVLEQSQQIFVHFQALVGNEHSQQFHVFELTRQLPRFSMYAVLENYLFKNDEVPDGKQYIVLRYLFELMCIVYAIFSIQTSGSPKTTYHL